MMAAASIEQTLSMTSPCVRTGVFVAVVGPGSAGKDAVVQYALDRLQHDATYYFVGQAFAGRFESFPALSPAAISNEMEAGSVVIACVSRRILPELCKAYAHVFIVHISTSPGTLGKRLSRIGQETPSAVEGRMRRSVEGGVEQAYIAMLDNSGPVDIAGERFIAQLKKAAARAALSNQL